MFKFLSLLFSIGFLFGCAHGAHTTPTPQRETASVDELANYINEVKDVTRGRTPEQKIAARDNVKILNDIYQVRQQIEKIDLEIREKVAKIENDAVIKITPLLERQDALLDAQNAADEVLSSSGPPRAVPDSVMRSLMDFKHGSCLITKTDRPDVYHVEKEDVKIEVEINPNRSEQNYFETLNQIQFVSDPSVTIRRGYILNFRPSANLILSVKNLSIKKSLFSGKKINPNPGDFISESLGLSTASRTINCLDK